MGHFLEEHRGTVANSLNDEGILSGERHGTADHVEEYHLQCPLCPAAVFQQPRQIPIMESIYRVLNIVDTGATGSKDLLSSHDLDQFFL